MLVEHRMRQVLQTYVAAALIPLTESWSGQHVNNIYASRTPTLGTLNCHRCHGRPKRCLWSRVFAMEGISIREKFTLKTKTRKVDAGYGCSVPGTLSWLRVVDPSVYELRRELTIKDAYT